MNRAETEKQRAGGRVASGAATARLLGPWLLIARAVWIVLVVPSLVLFVAGLPVYYQHVQTACVTPATCFVAGALPARELQQLASLGFSASTYAAVLTSFYALSIAIWGGVGVFIFLRRSDDWLALLGAFFLVTGGVSAAGSPAYALSLASPGLTWSFNLVTFLGQVALGAFLLFFPNGRLVPRWIVPIVPYLLLGTVYAFSSSFPTSALPYNSYWPEWLFDLASLLFPGGLIASQIYRYMRVSTPLQRQQTKWIVLGATAAISVSIGFLVIAILIPSLANNVVFGTVWANSFSLALLLIPVSIGFSIMRYRLYDIDVLINRALVYGSLSALLALVYLVGVIGSQMVVSRVTHSSGEQQSPLIIVITTLVIAALIRPLRGRIQAFIDQRFYRTKYDAARTLAAFATTLREEVDMHELTDHLLGAVDETMQPAQVSLWLRRSDHHAD